MSSYYGVIFPEFWTGRTGRELRERGGKDAQVLALYLTSNRHANMIGLYRLLVDDIKHETGLGLKAIERGYAAVASTDFARFDAATSFVWVRQMVRFRLGLKTGAVLDPEDKRVLGVNRIYHAIDANPFLGEFFDVNRKILSLKKRREPFGLVVPFSDHHNMSPLPSPLEGACKPDTEIRNREQIQIQKKARLTPPEPDETPERNRNVIRALVADVVRRAEPDTAFADLKLDAKQACADRGLAYDAEVVGSALEQALARKAHAS